MSYVHVSKAHFGCCAYSYYDDDACDDYSPSYLNFCGIRFAANKIFKC